MAGGFDDFFIVTRELDPDALTLQKEEVAAVRRVSLKEAEELLDEGAFIPYPRGFIRFLFEMRDQFGFPTK